MTVVTTPKGNLIRNGSAARDSSRIEPVEGKENNWLQTVPGKGYFAILRLYSPKASFFDKSWRPSEIEPV